MKFVKTVLPMLGLLLSQSALADDGLSGANTAWILTSTALVLMMTMDQHAMLVRSQLLVLMLALLLMTQRPAQPMSQLLVLVALLLMLVARLRAQHMSNCW